MRHTPTASKLGPIFSLIVVLNLLRCLRLEWGRHRDYRHGQHDHHVGYDLDFRYHYLFLAIDKLVGADRGRTTGSHRRGGAAHSLGDAISA